MIRKVLIVDDDETIRNLCIRSLKKEGYVVSSVPNGDKAIELLSGTSFDFDLVITDLLMPGKMDGKKFLLEVKNKKPETDVVIMTGHPSMESAVTALKEGAYDYLIKPFSPDELSSVVKRCIEKKQLKENLEKAYKELKILNDSREMFMQLLVHDMKNPLGGIMGNTQIMLMDTLNQEQRETLEDILHSSERLHKMVLNLLDIGQMEEGRFLPKYTPIKVVELFEEARQLIKNHLELKKINISINIPDTIILWADRELMLRILQNLLDNCLRYTFEGGNIELSAWERENGLISIRIRDSGQMISDEHKESIFTRYGRMTKSSERTNRGLGLYFCKLAIESHGGTIQLEDSKEGCSFLMQLSNKANRKVIRSQS